MRSQEQLVIGMLAALALAVIPTAQAESSRDRGSETTGSGGSESLSATTTAPTQDELAEDESTRKVSSLYSVRWVRIGNGGRSAATLSEGQTVNLQDSFGQPVAGTAEGGRFRLKTFLSSGDALFSDGFESGDTSAWAQQSPLWNQ